MIRARADGVLIDVHVVPRARTTALDGTHGAAIRIRLAAPPADGAANDALVAFVATRLGVPRAAVAIVRGATSRRKTLAVTGVTAAEATTLLGG